MKKIIFIITHYPPYDYWERDKYIPKYNWKNKNNQILGFDGIGWGDQLLEQFKKYDQKGYSYEVWQPDSRADKIYEVVLDSGVKHRLFPAKEKFTKLTLLNGNKEFICKGMFTEIKKLLQSKADFLIHTFVNNRYNTRVLVKSFSQNVPFLFQFATNSEYDPHFGTKKVRDLRKRIKYLLIKKYYKRIRYLIPATETTLNVKSKNISVYKRGSVANVGVNEEVIAKEGRSALRKNLRIKDNTRIFFASQRITPSKQIDKLIDAFSLAKGDYHLYISGAGTTDYTNYLQNKVNQNGLNNKITLLGFISEKELNEYYSITDIFISSSVSEAGPASTYKALLWEIPIITTDTGIAYEFLRQQDAGEILEKEKSSEWHTTINSILNNDIKIKMPNINQVKLFFDWEQISKYYLNIYKQINIKY